jgi:hypothetical protein
MGLMLLSAFALVAAASIARGQARETVPLPNPIVVSGNDVGFRIEGQQGRTPVGKIVVRIKGEWVEAAIAPMGKPPLIAVPLTERPINPMFPGGRRP